MTTNPDKTGCAECGEFEMHADGCKHDDISHGSPVLDSERRNPDSRVCAECGHSDGVDRGGQCVHRLDVPADSVAVWDDNHCGHRCTFPDSERHEFTPDEFRVCKVCGAQGDILCQQGQQPRSADCHVPRRSAVYCYCGERGEHVCDPTKCVNPDCWVGATMVGWPHDKSECAAPPEPSGPPAQPVCEQCESNARWNEAGGYHAAAFKCREYCRAGHRPAPEAAVEDALAELRTLNPKGFCEIMFPTESGTAKNYLANVVIAVWDESRERGSLLHFDDVTLEAAMQQVRDWKEQSNG